MKRWGLVLFVFLLFQEQGNFVKVKADDGFIRTQGVQLLLNGIPFYANGFNAYWLMYMAADPSQKTKVSSAFQQAKQHVYTAIYSSARGGGAAIGGLFWQLFAEGMDSFRDGYEVIMSEGTSTVNLITQESQKLNHIRKMYERLKNIEKWKQARDIKRAQWWAGNGVSNTGN
ncbi:hypothetical protein REPUB_Repub19eG0026900 [Reevesia pubescens]